MCAKQHQGRMSQKIIMAIDGKTANWHFTHTFLSNGCIPPTCRNAEGEKSMCWVTHHKVLCTCRAYVQMKNCSCMDEGGKQDIDLELHFKRSSCLWLIAEMQLTPTTVSTQTGWLHTKFRRILNVVRKLKYDTLIYK